MPVRVMTGYAGNVVIGNGHLDAGMPVITEPFGMTDVANEIREMIEMKDMRPLCL